MENPWRGIPLTDYESHMELPQVAQAKLLAEELGAVLTRYAPDSIAVLGCAGGNGFDRIAAAATPRVVGVDINASYIEAARVRFAARVPVLELYVADLARDRLDFAPVDLIYCALLLEYVDPQTLLPKMRAALRPGGRLVTLIQLRSNDSTAVTPSPFVSLGVLASMMRLVAPDELESLARVSGFEPVVSRTHAADGGKCFQLQVFAT